MTEYKRVTVDGKKVLLHRVIMGRHLGRPLRKDEYVYHLNGDRHDNRIENLKLVGAADHGRHLGQAGQKREQRELTAMQAKGIKAAHEVFPDRPLAHIAHDFHVPVEMIKEVIEGRKFADVTPDLRYSRRVRPDYETTEATRRLRPEYHEAVEAL